MHLKNIYLPFFYFDFYALSRKSISIEQNKGDQNENRIIFSNNVYS